ncbi:MAG: acetate--CoA ligase family protein [Myxococcota bacterium]|nr:acetate--CoA ligase family protein [Myxococcota bacterium]
MSTATAVRVQVIAPAHLGATAVAALRARAIDAKLGHASAISTDDIVAWALETSPSGARAVELAAICTRAAEAGRPIVLLAPPARGTGRAAIERAAAITYLRAHGAALSHDVDAWLEAVVLLVRFGLPQGPRAAVIAPPGSWLEAQVTAIALDAESTGARSPLSAPDDPTDVVLYDPELGTPPRTTPGMHVPIAARGELAPMAGSQANDEPMLHTARAALGAVAILGHAAERIRVGLGPAPSSASAELAIDAELVERQLKKLERDGTAGNIGDHDTKALLKAYGVTITRQAVAQTPADAVKKARRAGFPVELKPFGRDLPSEPDGCPVEKNLTSDALVRQAFARVLIAAGRSPTENTYVIVRETPPAGRDVSVSFIKLPELGWTVVLEGVQLAAAPAPLRLVDAQMLAAHLPASRSGEGELDRAGLANVMRRASHLVVDLDARLVGLELPRVIVGGRGARTIVVDAAAELL